MKIGVLALQGAFAEHVAMLRGLGVAVEEVRKPEQLATLDGLIMPGGESTTMGLVAERWGLVEPLRQWVHGGKPTWGTCAGMILLANRAAGQKQGGQPLIGGLDVTVNRNYFGRQNQSFELLLDVPALGAPPFRALFIRAPAIMAVAPGVEVLALAPGHTAPQPTEPDAGATSRPATVIVAVRQRNLLATAFHPELTDDARWHRLFVDLVAQADGVRRAAGAMP